MILDAMPEPAHTSSSQRRLPIGEAFSSRHNSLNFIRLLFCLMVIFSHTIVLGGFGNEWIFGNRTTMGDFAVTGFFCLSGFLIAGSATRNRVGRYLWQRFLRIMPAYWLCLIVTAFVIGALTRGSIKRTHPLAASSRATTPLATTVLQRTCITTSFSE